ncbi:CidB/LrgB family autolysis modulator [Pyrococcus furiosus DSM 3638]|uniref:Murein hydrolase n=3 Tax=Pyrococcus furiosus TaxID=2261 RepID=Q8TZY0_PYRFU|nr:CidB/LrgB family autolysis modulator [Pyrococcus furiosus]AAL81969.1 murein hydrolase [Pyrococcus furiosus DSM 3638]AFN04796.1 murein hydrolase [Pyrococcus furiosus COM1]QEK79446.1 CidB/LrgB family autolysis modulator [Pyrococcus furiosus DSM 3638]
MNTFGIFLTISAYTFFSWAYSKKKTPILNPVLLSILLIALILKVGNISYEKYMESARFLSFLLGPAVVSLAIPLYKQINIVKEYKKEIATGIITGGTTAILSAVYILKAFNSPEILQRTIAPKSVTTAIAMGVSEKIGGIPELTAVLVILTGILGNALAPELLDFFKIKDRVARGLATGVSSHGLGTARIILEDELSGAVSGLAMALNGVYTAFLLPLIIELIV